MSNLSNKATLVKTAVVSVWIGVIAITNQVMAKDVAEQDLAGLLTAQKQQVSQAINESAKQQLQQSLSNFGIDITMDMVTLQVEEQMTKAEDKAQVTTAKASR